MDDCCVRTAMIDADGVVVNVVIVCPNAECEHHPGTWEAPEGYTTVTLDADQPVSPGDTYGDGVFIPAPVPEPTEGQQAAATLAQYRERGWDDLTEAERADIPRLNFLAGTG